MYRQDINEKGRAISRAALEFNRIAKAGQGTTASSQMVQMVPTIAPP
jgi:hypothetical protein